MEKVLKHVGRSSSCCGTYSTREGNYWEERQNGNRWRAMSLLKMKKKIEISTQLKNVIQFFINYRKQNNKNNKESHHISIVLSQIRLMNMKIVKAKLVTVITWKKKHYYRKYHLSPHHNITINQNQLLFAIYKYFFPFIFFQLTELIIHSDVTSEAFVVFEKFTGSDLPVQVIGVIHVGTPRAEVVLKVTAVTLLTRKSAHLEANQTSLVY